MFPLTLPPIFPTLHCDDGTEESPVQDQKRLSTAISAVKDKISVQESELKRWRRVFDTHAKLGDDGEKYVIKSPDGFEYTLRLYVTATRSSYRLFLDLFKVFGYRIIHQGHCSLRRLDENRSKTIRHFIPRRRYLQAWFGVLGRFCGVRDVVEEA